jgi:hypothetical protein
MRVFWLNGGLQLQPETDVEAEAMLVLMESVKYERPPESDGPRIQAHEAGLLGNVERGLDLNL